MQEVRVESLEGLTRTAGELRLSANGGTVRIVFPHALWETIVEESAVEKEPGAEEPGVEELAQLEEIRARLEAHAAGEAFAQARRAVATGDFEYDLVLRPAGLYALTTGYHFAPAVGEELILRLGTSLRRGGPIEQVYAIGAVASEAALRAGDENLKVLSIRGRRCTASRFEMAPELWQVLSGELGWRDVETFVDPADGREA